MNYENKITLRDLGPNLPVSIGTAFAVEIFGGHAEGRDPEPEAKVFPEELWVNIRTLFRNMHNASSKEVKLGAVSSEFVESMDQELKLIRDYVRDATADKVKVKFYACLYKDMKRQFPKALLKDPTTPAQITYASLENDIVGHYSEAEESEVITFNNSLITEHKHVWLLTSSSIELLELAKFKKGLLLESHTGRLKNSIQIYTKLTNGSKLGNIPFNKITLQIYGDKGNLFSPMPKAVKDAVKEVADTNRWTPATNWSKFKYDLNGMKDRLGAKSILSLA